MSASPQSTAQDDRLHIEINGQALTARQGDMIIQAADAAGIPIPRFCYHKKLPIAANCRMCLVEAEMGGRKSPKPLPACATPLADGMKIWTQSKLALDAQRGVMEFLLINHPLDCPICDQGGECELQDLSLGYGRGLSRFQEQKRVVADQNLGPLIATEMTRCIHCTRCVRVVEEIGGYKELGATGRGENTRIGTYIKQSVDSEMSGNVIDVCPVGALTSKPFRFRARAWELMQRDGVAAHDGIGSNIHFHTYQGRVIRVVPRENEALNEVWLSDRDRFAYQGLNSPERLTAPMLKDHGKWKAVAWDTALDAVHKALTDVLESAGPEQIGFLISPQATLEEMVLAQTLARGIGCPNIDYRLRQSDFRAETPVFPWLGMGVEALERLDAALLIGSNVRKDQPIANHRLRKAARNGARIAFLNPVPADINIDHVVERVHAPAGLVRDAAAVVNALVRIGGRPAPAAVAGLVQDVEPEDAHNDIARALYTGERGAVILGNAAMAHPNLAELTALGQAVAELSGARFGYLAEAANTVGGSLAGVLPGRGPGGEAVADGLNAKAMIDARLKAYVLVGVEPDRDTADPAAAMAALNDAAVVVALSAYESAALKGVADALLAVTPYSETAGTFVNAEGTWQSFTAAERPRDDARPGWKALRVLANLFDVAGCEQISAQEVRDALAARCAKLQPDNRVAAAADLAMPQPAQGLQRSGSVAAYALDPVVRRAPALQATADARNARQARMNPADAERLNLREGDVISITQGDACASLPLHLDPRIPEGVADIPLGLEETAALGVGFGPIEVRPADQEHD